MTKTNQHIEDEVQKLTDELWKIKEDELGYHEFRELIRFYTEAFQKYTRAEFAREVKEKLEKMNNKIIVEHGRQCEAGLRPCGAVKKPEKLADRCYESDQFDESTLKSVQQIISEVMEVK